jgi:hypothetical protein
MSLKALAPALAKVDPEMKDAPKAAKEAFGDGDDRVRLEATGGNTFTLKLTLPTAALTFANTLDKARTGK